MKNILAFCVAFVVISAVALAGPVDVLFTGTNWTTDCLSCGGTNPNGEHSVSWNVGGGFTLSISAWIIETGTSSLTAKNLWWDSIDGFGVDQSSGSYEKDEVEWPELIIMSLSSGGAEMTDLFITDLFVDGTQGDAYPEVGFYSYDPFYSLSASGLHTFQGTQPYTPSYNGDLSVALTSGSADLYLSAYGLTNLPAYTNTNQNHDYSIAGVRVDVPTDVPEPTTLMLLGLGLMAGALWSWKYRVQ